MTTLDHRPPHAPTHVRAPHSPASRPHGGGRSHPAGWERNGDRRDRVHLALSELFDERDDLGGVSAVADVLAEDLLWSV